MTTQQQRGEDFKRGLQFIGIAVVIIFLLFLTGVCKIPSNRYTKEDCIRQWHEQGIYANAAAYCADYE